MERSIYTVKIGLARETISLPWTSRAALLEQFKDVDSMWELRKAFEDVGTSRPVTLTREQRADLLAVIVHWADAEKGYDRLPEGVFDLRSALQDDLHDAAAKSRP